MALKWFDGGEIWGVSTYFDRAYLNADASTLTPGRISPGSFRIAVSGGGDLTTPSLGVQNTWVSGFGLRHGFVATGNKWRYAALTGATEQCRVELWEVSSNVGELRLYQGASLVDTSTSFATNVWGFIEIKLVVRGATNGSYEIRYNESTIMSGSGVNLAASGSDGADAFQIGGSDQGFDLDDWYILDDTGSLNTDFLGEQVAVGLFPTSEGHQIDWTPSSGSDNALLVDDPPNVTPNDADYVSSSTVNDEDYYVYDNMPSTGLGTINGLRMSNGAQLETAGARTVQPRCYIGATEYDLGSDFSVDGTSIFEKTTVVEASPATAAKWTKAEIDGAEFGMELAT